MKSIKWLKMCYSGRDMGAVYPVEGEFNGFLFFTDDWGRPSCVHTRYAGILFEEVSHAS
jgi:hypothetical protein